MGGIMFTRKPGFAVYAMLTSEAILGAKPKSDRRG